MSTAIQLRDESFLTRNVAFRLQDMSPSHRQRVFGRAVGHCPPAIFYYYNRRYMPLIARSILRSEGWAGLPLRG